MKMYGLFFCEYEYDRYYSEIVETKDLKCVSTSFDTLMDKAGGTVRTLEEHLELKCEAYPHFFVEEVEVI